MKILLIEDDVHIGDGLYHGLQKQGFSVDWLKNGKHGQDALFAMPFDAVASLHDLQVQMLKTEGGFCAQLIKSSKEQA